jgi:peptide/nickel transport system ATP-binding protein
MTSLLEVEGVSRTFHTGPHQVRALDDVGLTLDEGEAIGLVGESGSGKTTLGRIITRLETADAGSVRFRGEEVLALRGQRLLEYRRHVQIVFQSSVFNARRSVLDLICDGYAIHDLVPRRERRAAALTALEQVGLPATLLDRYPHQCSSGQRQRLGIARALSVDPALLVMDEPTSALDVSVQAQVLNLIAELRERRRLTLLMISHDLRAVYFLCERIAVLYLGHLVELAPRERILEQPKHPYTAGLVRSVPLFRPGAGFTRKPLSGEIGDHPQPDGCPFVARCPLNAKLGRPIECRDRRPALRRLDGSVVACHFAEQADGAGSPLASAESVPA